MGLKQKLFDCPAEHADIATTSGISARRRTITAAINFARSFGLTPIAEGVETEAQLRELTALKCDLAQGYLWSRPVEAEKVSQLIESIGKARHDKLIHAA